MMLSDVCLSVAYIGPKSGTERPRKTKIGIEVAHVTRDSDTTFKVKRSKVKVTRPLYSPRRLRIRQLQQVLTVFTVRTCCYVAVRRGRLGGARRFGAHRGRRWAAAYCGGSRTACHYLLLPGWRRSGCRRRRRCSRTTRRSLADRRASR